MTRESLGTFRIHLFTCDRCDTTARVETRGSRQVKPPTGWGHLKLQVGDGAPVEADVCSPDCADQWTRLQLAPLPPEPAS